MHGHHYLRKAQLRENAAMEEELEEDLDEEDNRDGALDFFRSMPGRRSIQTSPRDKTSNKYGGGAPFEQGETLDFLNFLRGANYDHRQCPNEVEADTG